MLENRTNHLLVKATLLETGLLVAVAFAIHALVLLFVYPGYYDPLWPNHDDFYMPVALANSGIAISEYFTGARPVGMLFFAAIGHLGLHGSMFAVIAVIMLNCALTAVLVRRVASIRSSWAYFLTFGLYVFVVFAQPYFYVFAVHDAHAQLSFLLLMLAGGCFYEHSLRPRRALLVSAAGLLLLAFLSKETYGLTALFLAGIWFLIRQKRDRVRALVPALMIGMTLGLALLFNFLNHSPFTGGTAKDSDPYHVVLKPASVLSEWVRYADAGTNYLTVMMVLAVAVFAWMFRRQYSTAPWLVVLLPVAAAFAWLPNAVLPNHYIPEYSWNGAYLLYAPLLLLTPLLHAGIRSSLVALVITVLVFVSPVYHAQAYKANEFTLLQETNQRNLVGELDRLIRSLPNDHGAQSILISGLDFPFSPFDQGDSVAMFHNVEKLHFDIISYKSRIGRTQSTPGKSRYANAVRFIPANQVDVTGYQRIWAFRSDGTLITEIRAPRKFRPADSTKTLFSVAEVIAFPKLMDIFKDSTSSGTGVQGPDGYAFLNCGIALADYANYSGAQKCLLRSADLLGSSPYPYFYLGNTYEAQRDFKEAENAFMKAVRLDNPTASNPYFLLQAAEMRKKLEAPAK